jgi:type VI protein secretion system component VasF
MAPEQEDRTRQLEALRRYVSNLYERREPAQAEAAQPSPAPEPEPQRPSRRWLLLAGLLVVLALVGGVVVGAVAWSDDRPVGAEAGVEGVSSPTHSPTVTSGSPSSNTTTVAPVASPACKTAVDRANTMLAIAVKLQAELAEYSRIMSDPSTGNLSGREVAERSAPSLQAGSSDSARLNQALADYRQVVDQCKLQTP